MKMLCILFSFFLVCCVLAQSMVEEEKVQPLEIDWCEGENKVFDAGEEIVYKIYYNLKFIWIPAGEVRFRIRDSSDVYIAEAFGRTYASYNWFFRVKDYYKSVIDKSTLLPEMAIRDVNEGRYQRYEKVYFDQERKLAKSIWGRSKFSTNEREISLASCHHDILSVMYYTRNLEVDRMQLGEFFPLKIYLNRKSYEVKISYAGRDPDKKIHGQGRFKTKLFHPELLHSSVFKKGDHMTIWVTDDRNKLPLMIESDISIGKVKVVLKSYRGLRYSLDAQR